MSKRSKRTNSRVIEEGKPKFVLTPLVAAISTALYPVNNILAQQDDLALEEITVTATKRELNLQDVAQSIDVLSATDLIRMGAKDMKATLRALPSTTITSMKPGMHSLVIRGISSNPFEYRTESQVAVYLDEQPLTFNSQQVGVRNIDMTRIENLPGPQGTLFGSSSQTGTIRYITNKPDTSGFYGQVESRFGTTKGGEASYDINGMLNLPLTDTFAIRAVGYTSHDGGYVDNVLGSSLAGNYDNAEIAEEDQNEYDVDGGRISALWNLGENWSALFSIIGEKNETSGVWATDPYLGDYKVTRFEEEFRDDKWHNAAITLRGDLGFADFSLAATQFNRDIAYQYDNGVYQQGKDRLYGGGLYREQYYAGNPYYYNYYNWGMYDTNYYRGTVNTIQRQESEAVELRLTSKSESRLQWMVGGYFEDIMDEWFVVTQVPNMTETRAWYYANYYANYYSNPHYYAYSYYPGNPLQDSPIPNPSVTHRGQSFNDVNFLYFVNRQISQSAIFGELSYDLTEKLKVHGGMRWAEFDRDVFTQQQWPIGLAPWSDRSTGDGSFQDVGKDSDTIYKVGLQYNFDDDRMAYLLYSQGFRLGGVNSPVAADTGQVPLYYKPDFLDNYEFGIKSQWLDNRLTINASAFYMEWSDYQQVQTFNKWWLLGVFNAGSAETTGVEFNVDWQVTDRLLLTANFFTADPKFTSDITFEYVDGFALPNGELSIRKGMPMPNSPEATGSASVYYEIPDLLGGDVWLYYNVSYQGETWNTRSTIFNNETEGISPSWTYSTFSAGLMLPNQLDVEVNITNLFDQKGYTYVDQFWGNRNAEAFGDPRFRNMRTLDQPRTIWLTLRKGFGGT
ncbi:MAG: hypothetical protein CMO98_00975 [Woeseia sp.]|nr:hypothetical protein [Woeseia sp.]